MSLLRGIVACGLCGRSGGGIAEGADACHACTARNDPTPLQAWSAATGTPLRQLEAETGLPKKTIMRAASGQRMSASVARALAEATGIEEIAFTDDARNQEWKP